ncbi:MAG TPA: TonB-dependent receptor, partial [Blastocatellia bacterium]|nr:TonB-dependent receptor [Blastocatellia bacterium]
GEGARENVRSGLNDFNFKAVQKLTSRQALTAKFSYYGEDSNLTYSGLTEAEFQENPRGNVFRNDFFYGDRFGASAAHSLIFDGNTALTTNFYGAFFKRHWWRQSSNSRERPNRLNTLPGGDPDCLSMADLNTTCGNQGRLRQYYFWGIEPRLQSNHSLFGVRSVADLGFRAHYENQDRRQENGDLPTSRSGVLVEDNERKNQAYSAFVQNRFLFGDLAVTPGVRVEHVRYERTNRLLDVTGETELTEVVPGLGISYRLPRNTVIFAGAHRGFAPPRTEDVINNTTGGSIDLDPELSWNYEAGVRARLHPGVRFEGTFFVMDYENQIVPASLAGGVGSLLTNGGETLHRGIEISSQIDAGTILRSRHNVYLRSAYTWLPTAEFTGTRFSSVPGFANVSITGNRLPYAPENLLTASVGYANPVGLDAFVEAVFVGRQFTDDLNTVNPTPDGQRGAIPSYMVWNATANYRVERWRTTLFVTFKNLFDRTYIVDRSRGLLPGSPRLAQAGVKFNF